MPAVDEALAKRIESKFTPPERQAEKPEREPVRVTEVVDDPSIDAPDEPEDRAIESVPEAEQRVKEFYEEKSKPPEPEPEPEPPLTPDALNEPVFTMAEVQELNAFEQKGQQLWGAINEYEAHMAHASQLPAGEQRRKALLQLQQAKQVLEQHIELYGQGEQHFSNLVQQRLRERHGQRLIAEREKLQAAGVDLAATKTFLQNEGLTDEEIQAISDPRYAKMADESRRWRNLQANPTKAALPTKSALDRKVDTARKKFQASGTAHDGAEYLLLKQQQKAQRAKQKRRVQTVRKVSK